MILDIDVAARAWPFISSTGSSRGAVEECEAVSGSFSGVELAVGVLGLDGPGVPELLAQCAVADLGAAVAVRGTLLVSSAGRVGVAVGGGAVVAPAGRGYALVEADAQWWSSAWWPSTVTSTVPHGSAPARAAGLRRLPPGLVADVAHPGLYWVPPTLRVDPLRPRLYPVSPAVTL